MAHVMMVIGNSTKLMARESSSMPMAISMTVDGQTIDRTDMACTQTRKVPGMRAIGRMINNTVRVSNTGLKALVSKENTRTG